MRLAGVVLLPVLVVAQGAPSAPPPDPNAQFEAASVKAADPSSPGGRIMVRPGQVEMTGMAVRLMLRNALQVQDYQIVGAPDWTGSERYSIVAKAPDGMPQRNMPAMMTNLLKDRFKLVVHREMREMPIYALILARVDGRLGPNLKPTPPECQAQMSAARDGGPGRGGGPGGPGAAAGSGRPAGPPPGPLDFSKGAPCGMMGTTPGMVSAGGQPIQTLVTSLSNAAGRPVVDKTGLMGLYDFTLKWAFDPGQGVGPLGGAPPPGAPTPAVDPDAPNLFTALQEQLGLKLDSQRAPVEVVVIDRIERPTLD